MLPRDPKENPLATGDTDTDKDIKQYETPESRTADRSHDSSKLHDWCRVSQNAKDTYAWSGSSYS